MHQAIVHLLTYVLDRVWPKRPHNRVADPRAEELAESPDTPPMFKPVHGWWCAEKWSTLADLDTVLDKVFVPGQCSLFVQTYVRLWVGVALMRRGETREAIARFDQILSAPGTCPVLATDAYMNKTAALLDLRRYEDAVRCAKRGFEITRSDPSLNQNGLCAGSLCKDLTVCRLFGTELAANPNSHDTKSQMFRNLLEDDQLEWFRKQQLCKELLPVLFEKSQRRSRRASGNAKADVLLVASSVYAAVEVAVALLSVSGGHG